MIETNISTVELRELLELKEYTIEELETELTCARADYANEFVPGKRIGLRAQVKALVHELEFRETVAIVR